MSELSTITEQSTKKGGCNTAVTSCVHRVQAEARSEVVGAGRWDWWGASQEDRGLVGRLMLFLQGWISHLRTWVSFLPPHEAMFLLLPGEIKLGQGP